MASSKKSKLVSGSGWTTSFLNFRPSLERLLRRFVRQNEVEDLISETYLRTYERFGDDDVDHPKAFLYKTARNLALNHIAKHENRFTQPIADLTPTDVYLSSEELESQIEAQEKFRLFCTALEKLPPKCRRAFVLKRVHDWSTKDIAREMGISVSTVEKHIAKGLLLCTVELEQNGYDLRGMNSKKCSKDDAKHS